MANTRISDLTASASNLASTDLAPVVQTVGVGPVKMTGAQIAAGLLSATTPIGSGPILSRGGSATLQLGAADAAAPVAQTFKVQSVVAGTTNTAGANFTIQGSQGTGTGAGGSIIFQVAPAGSSGTAQNAYSTALTIDSTRLATFGGKLLVNAASGTTGNIIDVQVNGTSSFYADANGEIGSKVGGYFYANNTNFGFIAHKTSGNTVRVYTAQMGCPASYTIGWASTSDGGVAGGQDTILARDAAGVLGVRGSSTTTPGALSLYTYGASPPAAPSASIVRLYADTSGGKIRLMAIFPSGAAQQIAIEP